VTVVLPQRARESEALDAVVRFEPWIRARLAEVDASRAAVAARGATVPWLGLPLDLVPEPGRMVARRDGSRLIVPDGDWRPAVERLMRREARREFTERLDRVTEACGTSWSTLRIGDMKSRWGSCSPGGRMSFCWRLMLAPERVLETVVWHEACHIDVPNHSADFWRLMDARRPGHLDDREWLARHGGELIL
jgi:predicted metal-dependent hydrolase